MEPMTSRTAYYRGTVEEQMSLRRTVLGAVGVAVVAATFAPTEASARWRGGGWHGGGYGWGVPAVGLGLGLGLGIAGAGYYGGGPYGYYGGSPSYYGGYGYPAYGYAASPGCWRRAVVHTPYGPRTRRVWVCR